MSWGWRGRSVYIHGFISNSIINKPPKQHSLNCCFLFYLHSPLWHKRVESHCVGGKTTSNLVRCQDRSLYRHPWRQTEAQRLSIWLRVIKKPLSTCIKAHIDFQTLWYKKENTRKNTRKKNLWNMQNTQDTHKTLFLWYFSCRPSSEGNRTPWMNALPCTHL